MSDRRTGFRVTEAIHGTHPLHPKYPLLPGDLLVREPDGTWMKEAPGLAVGGFVLGEEHLSRLEVVEFTNSGLSYCVAE